jgi:arsenate reductase
MRSACQHFRDARDAIARPPGGARRLRDAPAPLAPTEFHASVRVPDLAAAARFYAWLLGVEPKEWTHRYVTFVSEALRRQLCGARVGRLTLHHDTLYHLGVALSDKAAVIDAHHRAVAAGWPIHKPARTTWRGTPLHELWLTDPGGNLVEVYARLTDEELAQRPESLEAVVLG